MPYNTGMRLDRFLSNQPHLSRKSARQLLREQRVCVNGCIVIDALYPVDIFSHIALLSTAGEAETLQLGQPRYHVMLHKPAGCVSATTDPEHPTVMDYLDQPWKDQLHLPGRLDFNTTGLLLLTNDGHWSRHLSLPDTGLAKTYHVTTRDPISPATKEIFARGIYFAFEDLTTRPAQLELLAPHEARLTIHEGRYHQIRRMFAAVDNKVTALHREQIGTVALDPDLNPGEWRFLTVEEIDALDCRPNRR